MAIWRSLMANPVLEYGAWLMPNILGANSRFIVATILPASANMILLCGKRLAMATTSSAKAVAANCADSSFDLLPSVLSAIDSTVLNIF